MSSKRKSKLVFVTPADMPRILRILRSPPPYFGLRETSLPGQTAFTIDTECERFRFAPMPGLEEIYKVCEPWFDDHHRKKLRSLIDRMSRQLEPSEAVPTQRTFAW